MDLGHGCYAAYIIPGGLLYTKKKKTKVKYFNINKSRHFLRYARLYHHHFGILWMPETLNNLEKEKKNSPLNKSIILSPFVSQIYSIDYIFVDKKKI